MTYRRALELLEARQETRIRLGLGRMRRHLRALGDPQEACVSVHVAGTNGKGSVCAMFDAVLRANGCRTGLYTSPHLRDVRERIRVDGRMIPPKAFARGVERALGVERSSPRDRLTYFELVTSVAFQHFRDAGARVVVLETGLGGRFDATNVVRRPAAAVIPSIDWDHMDFLGGSLESIAFEKAGIFKRGAPAYSAEDKPAPARALEREARRRRVGLRRLEAKDGFRTTAVDWRDGRQTVAAADGRSYRLGMLGGAQPRNAALVVMASEALRRRGVAVPERALREGLAAARWPGRFEVGRDARGPYVLDGAHNPQAMTVFRRTLESSPWARSPKLFVLGMLKDKEHDRMARVLAPCLAGQRVVATRPASPRALEPGALAREVARRAPSAHVTVLPSVSDALSQARGGRVLCVVGSFYLVGEARRLLGARDEL
ncbi:MAG: bifunctional folylpolyglutamate synthase/dihydrofolate synthase [Elusimicrobia bacterium]|nr:bifunctional folylpolyglutamate synthase/dihydrofolate synthase [Elusimicrobiota bacterium]